MMQAQCCMSNAERWIVFVKSLTVYGWCEVCTIGIPSVMTQLCYSSKWTETCIIKEAPHVTGESSPLNIWVPAFLLCSEVGLKGAASSNWVLLCVWEDIKGLKTHSFRPTRVKKSSMCMNRKLYINRLAFCHTVIQLLNSQAVKVSGYILVVCKK